MDSDWLTEEDLVRAAQEGVDEKARPGIDRMSAVQALSDIRKEAARIVGRVHAGTYRFAPYEQLLVPKGKDSHPREISIPSLRDRAVLIALKHKLHAILPHEVAREIPNAVIRNFLTGVKRKSLLGGAVVKADIKDFYPTISHARLMHELGRLGVPANPRVIALRAIRNPTRAAEADSSRKAVSVGVPQGLPISNVLANVFARQIDTIVNTTSVVYARYVDDIAAVTTASDADALLQRIQDAASGLGLALHPQKSKVVPSGRAFQFLGYELLLPRMVVQVRAASRQKFLRHVFSLIAQYRREAGPFAPDLGSRAERFSRLIRLVNLRITGAVEGKKRFGWLFYFSELTDLSMLFELDRVVRGALDRLPFVLGAKPPARRTLVETFHVMQSGAWGDYFPRLDRATTRELMIEWMVQHGAGAELELTGLQAPALLARFDRAKRGITRSLERDVGFAYT